MAWFQQMRSVRAWVRRYGRGRNIDRPMTDAEMADFDRAFDKMDDAFKALNDAFRKMRP